MASTLASPPADIDTDLGERLFGTVAADGTALPGILDLLHDAGLKIGPRERTAVATLVSELIALSGGLRMADLRSRLAPLLARSPQERADFFRVFDAAAPAAFSAPPRAAPQETTGPAQRVRLSLSWRQMAWIGGVLALTLGAFLISRIEPAPVVAAPEIQLAAPAPVAPPEPAVAPSDGEQSRNIAISLGRVREAADLYGGAPSLAELASAMSRSSEIAWSAAAYEQRLQELTGLPRHAPLALVQFEGGAANVSTWARISRAVHQIETPGREGAPDAYRAAAVASLAAAPAPEEGAAAPNGTSWRAVQLEQRLRVGAAGVALPEQREAAIAQVRAVLGEDVDAHLIERALALSRAPGLHRVWRDADWLPPQPEQSRTAPAWMPIALTGAPLLGLLWWLGANLARRRAFLRRRKPAYSPLHTDIVSDAAAHARFERGLVQRIGQRLQRRSARLSDRVDIPATISATISDGALMVRPVFARVRAMPEYLFLIERRGPDDQNYNRMRAMVQRLQDMVALEVYAYEHDPTVLERDGGGRVTPIERVMAAHPDHRLVVLGTGEAFLDPMTGKATLGATKLMHWEQRAMLTPVPLAEWAREEFAIASELAMPIGRATAEGFLGLADLLGLDGVAGDTLLVSAGDGLARPLPTKFRANPERYSYREPPEDHPVSQIVQDLRNYLDAPSFDWLCALAIYPSLQWDLTLYLGVTLPEQPRGDAQLAPLYREDRIGALTQLPWLRQGAMPNWLRRALIAAMPKARLDDVRARLQALIAAARSTGSDARDDAIRIRIAHEPRRDRWAPEEVLDDEVFLDFLAAGAVEDLELPSQNAFASALPEPLRRIGWPELVGVAVAAIYAAAVVLITPNPATGPLITGAFAPVLLLVAAALVALGLTHADETYRGFRAGAERAVACGLIISAMVGASLVAPSAERALSTTGYGRYWPGEFALVLLVGLAVFPIAITLARAAGVYARRPTAFWPRLWSYALDCVVCAAIALVIVSLTNSAGAS